MQKMAKTARQMVQTSRGALELVLGRRFRGNWGLRGDDPAAKLPALADVAIVVGVWNRGAAKSVAVRSEPYSRRNACARR